MNLKTRGRRGDGQFALIVPVFLLIVVGLLVFGRLFFYWIETNHPANETARWAVVDPIRTPRRCSARPSEPRRESSRATARSASTFPRPLRATQRTRSTLLRLAIRSAFAFISHSQSLEGGRS